MGVINFLPTYVPLETSRGVAASFSTIVHEELQSYSIVEMICKSKDLS